MGMLLDSSPAGQVPDGHRRRGAMNGLVTALLTVGLLLSSLMNAFGAAGVAAQGASQPQVQVPLPPPGRVIVVLRPGARAAEVARGVNATPRQLYGQVFNGFAATLPAAAIQALARNPNVAYLAGDKPVTAVAQTQPTGVQRIGATGNAVAAIDGVDTSVGADIAVIDTGIDPSHPDLNVAGGVDCVASDNKNSYTDDNGHGTHVAGTAAARDNGVGVVGVAPGATLWAVKVLNASQGGYLSDVICGLDWVVANAGTIDVVNMSLTTSMTTVGTCASPNGDAFHTAICAVVDAGVTVVAAAGNSTKDAAATAPAMYEEVIAVSAVTDYDGRPGKLSTATGCSGGDDTFATYSNFGAIVDIAAPGSCITSTLPGSYGAMSGTSMATPHVAGAAALFRSRNAGASPGTVRLWLLTEAAQPQASTAGFSGDPDGVPEPMLTLAASVPGERYPPGDVNPSFRGSRLSIARSMASAGTTAANLAYDGSTGTSWETTGDVVPTKATLTLDLGATRMLTGLKWVYRQTGAADEVLIQTSLDNVSWRTVGRYGNAPAGSWYGEDLARDGRYVRLMFLNPNADPVLGYLAEVQLWGGVSYPPGTAYPSFSGAKLAIARSTGSSNANASTRAHDGSTSTSYETTVTTTPTNSAVRVDLGATRRLSGIKWRFRVTGAADEMLIQTSIDGSSWRTVGRYGNAPAGRWYGVATSRDARYVRFTLLNPNRDPVLGYIAEVEVWGTSTTSTAAQAAASQATATPTMTTTPTATAAPTETAPTADLATRTGVVTGTEGEGVRCRVAPDAEAEILVVVPEGTALLVTGDVRDGWYSVQCGETAGYVRAEFLTVDGAAPQPTSTAPTAVPTDAATPAPYAIVAAGDTEQSGTAALAADGNAATAWFVVPAQSPDEARLVLDLGEERPIDRVEWELAGAATLGTFEIWLSNDNVTWWSLGPIDSGTMAPATRYSVEVGSVARYVAFVVPNVSDNSGGPRVGGLAEVRIWPAASAAPLTDRGAPVTPTPAVNAAAGIEPTAPAEPTEAPATGGEGLSVEAQAEESSGVADQTAEPTPTEPDA